MVKTMHRPIHEGVLRALDGIFGDGRPADKVIQFALKENRKWGSQDRRLFAECVYDLVRWWRKLLFICDIEWPANDRWSANRNAHALALEAWCDLHDVELGRGVERRMDIDAKARWADKSMPLAVRESIPDWLDKWGTEELGSRWESLLPALNSVAPVYIRANRLKSSPAEVQKKLKLEGIETELCGDDALRLRKRSNVFLTKAFHAGLFEIQDLSSQHVAPALQVEPGHRVIDACAGGGGKSLHLAALLKNKGKIISMDVHPKKLDQLRERATRAGATLIETRVIEGSKTWKRLEADRLLLDVPCSGVGVLRRNPDSKWRLTPEEIVKTRALQAEILNGYSQMCKPGGVMVYATCSIMPSENSLQVAAFVKAKGDEFTLEHEETLWPERDGADGFYLARLRRKSQNENSKNS